MGMYTSNNALREKVVWQANGRRLSVDNFDGKNVDKLIKIRQICQHFSIKILSHMVYMHTG